MRTSSVFRLAWVVAVLGATVALADEMELAKHDYAKFKFSLSTPAFWVESAQETGVKWEVENKAATCEITVWSERKDLGEVESNLRAKAKENEWTFVEPPKRIKIDGCTAFYMLVDIAGEYPVRQLFVVVDEPLGTYLLTYGDLAADFNRDLIDRIAVTFKALPEGTAAAGPEEGASEPAGDWGCPTCKKVWPKDQKFCGQCGGKNEVLAPERWGCPVCKKEWPKDQKFCGECGGKNGPF